MIRSGSTNPLNQARGERLDQQPEVLVTVKDGASVLE